MVAGAPWWEVGSRLPIGDLTRALGRESDTTALEQKRDHLVEQVLAAAIDGETK